ncbi:MAG: IS4 family transposase, partial [Candidatus Poribacteria bacterium]|nr:IS4 family transposase [Candidatus Poribacteria bacterium]
KEKFLLRLVRLTGINTHNKQQGSWLWCGREPAVVDGSSFLMADTTENQGEYPQHKNQAKGCGFPIGRIVLLFSLATGAVLDSAISAFCVGEINLFRRLYPHLKAGSVVLGDRIFGTYCDICLLLARGVDAVFRLHGARKTDFRKGKCISRWDHIIHWTKPKKCPVGLTQQQFNALPAQLLLREVRFQIPFKGFRTEDVTLVTTLLDAKLYSMSALAELYRLRWQVELDIRILKTTMKMEHLWSKTPEMIRKEFYIHLLAYNLIRQLQFEAGIESEALPITLSFKATVQHFSNFVVLLAHSIAQRRIHFYHQLIMLISKEILDVRSNRVEPRVVKRRPKSYRRMTVPRKQLKRKCKNRKINPQTAQMTPSY